MVLSPQKKRDSRFRLDPSRTPLHHFPSAWDLWGESSLTPPLWKEMLLFILPFAYPFYSVGLDHMKCLGLQPKSYRRILNNP